MQLLVYVVLPIENLYVVSYYLQREKNLTAGAYFVTHSKDQLKLNI